MNSGDVAFGKEVQLENQARMGLRVAHFISSFLQLVNPKELFAEFRVPDKPLTQEQLIGEAVATVIGDKKIIGCGILFDRNAFANKTTFAPYAYRKDRNARVFFVDDLSRQDVLHYHGSSSSEYTRTNKYLEYEYFSHLKRRWASNTDDLETYTAKINIR